MTAPPPVSVTFAAMMRSVAAPVEFSVILPLLSNVPPISSAAPLPTLIVPAFAPVPVPWVMASVPCATASVAALAVLSDLIVWLEETVTV